MSGITGRWLLSMVVGCVLAAAVAAAPQARGKVAQVSGRADLYMAAFNKWKQGVQGGQDLFVGDRLQTQAGASAKVTLYSSSGQDTIEVAPDTLLEIPDVFENKDETTWVGMFSAAVGKLKCLISRRPPAEGAPASFNVRTPTVVAGVRGTEFNVEYERRRNISFLGLNKGALNAIMAGGALAGLVSTNEEVAITGLKVFRYAAHLRNAQVFHDAVDTVNEKYNLLFSLAETSVEAGTLVNGTMVFGRFEEVWARSELPFEGPNVGWDNPMVVKTAKGHCILHLRHTGWFMLEEGSEMSCYRMGNAIMIRLREGVLHFHRSDPTQKPLRKGPAMDVEVFMAKDDATDLRVIDFTPKGGVTRATLTMKPGRPTVDVREGEMKVLEVR